VGKQALRVEVRVTPRASRDEVVGTRDGVLAVRVRAAPVDDAANRAVVKLVAKHLAVPASRVSVIRGRSARRKLLEVRGT
jgi:uncharacterized protein